MITCNVCGHLNNPSRVTCEECGSDLSDSEDLFFDDEFDSESDDSAMDEFDEIGSYDESYYGE